MTEQMKEVYEAYVQACYAFLAGFNKTHGVEGRWLENDIGNIAVVNEEYYINMEDMVLMLLRDIPWKEYVAYIDYNSECAFLSLSQMTFRSWCDGARRYSKEQIERLKAMHKELEELTEQTKNSINGTTDF